jgi:hypothetical protein
LPISERQNIIDVIDIIRFKMGIDDHDEEKSGLHRLTDIIFYKPLNMVMNMAKFVGLLPDEKDSIDKQELADLMLEPNTQKEITRALMGRSGIDWGHISRINNRFLNLFPVIFRVYKVKNMSRVIDLTEYAKEDQELLLSDTPSIHGNWKISDIQAVARLAIINKDWRQYIRSKYK